MPSWLIYARTPVVDARGETIGVAAVSRALRRPDRRHPTYERVSRATAALRSAYDRPLGLRAIARECGVSASQLERDFARVLELTPREIHTMARIDRALELLGEGMAVARVAQECGFADHSAFTRRFRALVGRTPLEYARQVRRAAPAPRVTSDRPADGAGQARRR
ncbi:MAG: helix-turn-helix domain-containing protein [Pseudomonadota bacterium]